MLCILTHALEDDWHQKWQNCLNIWKCMGAWFVSAGSRNLWHLINNLVLVFALVYHQINNFEDERVELVGGKKYGQVDALIAQRLGGKRFGRSRGPAQNTLAPHTKYQRNLHYFFQRLLWQNLQRKKQRILPVRWVYLLDALAFFVPYTITHSVIDFF